MYREMNSFRIALMARVLTKKYGESSVLNGLSHERRHEAHTYAFTRNRGGLAAARVGVKLWCSWGHRW